MARARKHKVGYWPLDWAVTGVTVTGYQDLAVILSIWPKLWRRLEEFLRQARSLAGLVTFLDRRNEREDILPLMEERGSTISSRSKATPCVCSNVRNTFA